MKAPVPVLREVRRGEELDELEFVLSDYTVLIAHAHGVHVDEAGRSREALLKVLRPVIEGAA